jgi:hypothetical protein
MLCVTGLNWLKLKVIALLIIHSFLASWHLRPKNFAQIKVMLMVVAAVSVAMGLLIACILRLVVLLLLLLHH